MGPPAWAELAARAAVLTASAANFKNRIDMNNPPCAGVRALWPVYLLAALSSAFWAFDGPSRQSLIPNLVPREHYPNAISLNTIMFQTAIPVGRFELEMNQIVDREQILKQVFTCPALPGMSLDDAWPFPHVEPWGMRVHPDCSVSMVLFRDSEGLHFAREWIDLERLNERLHTLATRARWINIAISLCVASAIFIASVVVTLFAGAFWGSDYRGVVAGLFIAAMLALIGGLVFFMREIYLATSSLRIGLH